MKKELVAHVKFANGAHFKCYLKEKVPSLAKEANDFILLRVLPAKGRGESFGLYMNIYDANNLIFALSQAILSAHERGDKIHPNL
jgi:hypothetical protein